MTFFTNHEESQASNFKTTWHLSGIINESSVPSNEKAGISAGGAMSYPLNSAADDIDKKGGTLLIGWAKTDLVPDLPVHLAAGSSIRIAEGVMDTITATALVIESVTENGSKDLVIMVSCDLAIIRNELRDRVRDLIRELQPGIDVEKIILNATHNHGAPCVRTDPELAAELSVYGLDIPADWSYYGISPDENTMSPGGFLEFSAPRIAAVIINAWKNRKVGGISFGLGYTVLGHNRLVAYDNGSSSQYGNMNRPDFSHIEGYEDHTIGIIYTFNKSGGLTGVVINVPCAAAGFGSHITADYFHETRNELRKRLGDSLYVLPQIAASAEQWPRVHLNQRANERMMKITGRNIRQELALRISNAVTSLLPYLKNHKELTPLFEHRIKQIELTRQYLSEEQFENRKQDFNQLLDKYRKVIKEIEANPDIRKQPDWYVEVSSIYWEMARAARVMRQFKLQETQPVVPVEVHAIRIGDMVIATQPLALYLDFGIQIKERSKAVQTFTVQTAAGHYRYLPTERSVTGGAYGAIPESIEFGPEGGRELVNGTIELINSLWEND